MEHLGLFNAGIPTLDGGPTTRARGGMAGAAKGLAAGGAGCLAGGFDEVQLVVAHETHPIEAKPRLAGQEFDQPDQRMPIEPDQPFALAPLYHHLEAMDRHI